MYTPRAEGNDSLLMEEQLANVSISGLEGCVSGEFGTVEAGDAPEPVSNPEKLLGGIECKGCDGW